MVSQQKSRIQPVAFSSGEGAPLSGVWRAEHEKCTVYELWLRKDELFPQCSQCGLSTSFILLEEVQHISEDPDFQS